MRTDRSLCALRWALCSGRTSEKAVLFFTSAAKQSDTVMPDEPTNRQIIAMIITAASKMYAVAFLRLCLCSTFLFILCFLLSDRVALIIYEF